MSSVVNLDAINYKNGQKNHWRKVMWNAIKARVESRQDALVIYLPGMTDLDRPEAIRRGFKPANLIAVERNPKVAKELRSKKTTTIECGLFEVVRSWPEKHRVSVLLADFQCGFNDYVADFLEVVSKHPAFDDCCMAINLQRGRDFPISISGDADSKAQKFAPDDLLDSFYDKLDADVYLHVENSRMELTRSSKNRIRSVEEWMAVLTADDRAAKSNFYSNALEKENLLIQSANDALDEVFKDLGVPFTFEEMAKDGLTKFENWMTSNFGSGDPRILKHSEKLHASIDTLERHSGIKNQAAKAIELMLKDIPFCRLPSYKSTPFSPVFDSGIFKYKSFIPRKSQPFDSEVRQKIIAALAIRTRRLRGELA